MRLLALAVVAAATLTLGATAQATVVPENCEVHNNDSLFDRVDLSQEAVDLFCTEGMSARTYCAAKTIDVGLPSDAAALLSARDRSAINLAKGIVIMFLGHQQRAHGYGGTYVKVRLFSGIHSYYAGKNPIATATTKIASLADTTPEFQIEFHRAPTRSPKPVVSPAQRDDWKCLKPDFEFSIFQAENVIQRMILTRTKDLTVLGFTIRDRGWQASNEISKVVLNVDGKHYARLARYGLPEIVLDAELAAALEGGLKVSIAIQSEEGNAHSYDASLMGFTRAHDCVRDKSATTISQSKPSTPAKRTVNLLPDDQRLFFTRGELHALKQIVGLCLVMLAHSSELSMDEIVKQIGVMQAEQNTDGLPEYYNKGVVDTFSRMVKALESPKK